MAKAIQSTALAIVVLAVHACSATGQYLDPVQIDNSVYLPPDKFDQYWVNVDKGTVPVLDLPIGTVPQSSCILYGFIVAANGRATEFRVFRQWPTYPPALKAAVLEAVEKNVSTRLYEPTIANHDRLAVGTFSMITIEVSGDRLRGDRLRGKCGT